MSVKTRWFCCCWCIFNVLPIVCGGSVFVFDLLCITLCPFKFCNHLEEVEKSGCFAFIVLQTSCYCKCSMALPHGALGWSAVCDFGISLSYSLIFCFGCFTLIVFLISCVYLCFICLPSDISSLLCHIGLWLWNCVAFIVFLVSWDCCRPLSPLSRGAVVLVCSVLLWNSLVIFTYLLF